MVIMTTQPEPDSLKMFVGQIPKSMTEAQLKEMMEEFGPVYQVGIILDKETSLSRGCAFVQFMKKKDAVSAQNALHGIRVLPGMHNPVQMKPADGQIQSLEERKVFVGMLPKTFTESDVVDLFASYGTVHECSVLRDHDGNSKGCAFIVFNTKLSAQQAIRNMHHSRILEGCKSAIVVKLADTARDKELKKMQSKHGLSASSFTFNSTPTGLSPNSFNQQQTVPSTFSQSKMQQQSFHASGLTGAMANPLAALAALGSLGMNATQLQQVLAAATLLAPLMQTQANQMGLPPQPSSMNLPQQSLGQLAANQTNTGLSNILASLVAANTAAGACGIGMQSLPGSDATAAKDISGLGASMVRLEQSLPANTSANTGGINLQNLQSAVHSYSAYGAPASMSHESGSVSGSLGSGAVTDLLTKAFSGIQQYAASFPMAYQNQPAASSSPAYNCAAGSQIEGPDGCNVFVYNLPEEVRDNDLLQLFLPFGTVVSAKVFIDKQTQQSKRFGFVSYDTQSAAQTAIQMMNSYQIGNRRLKVQLKKPKNENKPYQKF